MNYATTCCEIGFWLFAPNRTPGYRNVDFHMASDRQIEPRHKCRAAPAQIFAGSLFLKSYATAIPPAHRERQAYREPAIRALLQAGCTELEHGLGPPPLISTAP
jgi:hypothetical protein